MVSTVNIINQLMEDDMDGAEGLLTPLDAQSQLVFKTAYGLTFLLVGDDYNISDIDADVSPALQKSMIADSDSEDVYIYATAKADGMKVVIAVREDCEIDKVFILTDSSYSVMDSASANYPKIHDFYQYDFTTDVYDEVPEWIIDKETIFTYVGMEVAE
jgi:hypothetical protein